MRKRFTTEAAAGEATPTTESMELTDHGTDTADQDHRAKGRPLWSAGEGVVWVAPTDICWRTAY